MRLKTILLLTLATLAAASHAAPFTQADLEKMVAELDTAIPHNPAYKYPIKCTLVDKPDVNAYATYTDEGTDKRATMVVFTGLAKGAGDDQRLIRACVAHELTHLSKGHMTDINPSARDLKNLWVRQQEFEADKGGAEALVKTGHAKKDMVDLLLYLDRDQGRDGGWLGRLTADHADPKARAAELSDNPNALKALVLFDTGLAYEDSRAHNMARALFNGAASYWPDLSEAYINSARCSLMFYYDQLPKAVRAQWWRPDFGPLLTAPHVRAQAPVITPEDEENWKEALDDAQIAVAKNPKSEEAAALVALTKVLEPHLKKEVVQEGIDWFKTHLTTVSDDATKLRYANNAGLGIRQLGDLDAAYGTIMTAQKATTKFNPALAENLGRVTVKGRSKEDDLLAANVLFTYLGDTPKSSPTWPTVKKTFDEIIAAQGLTSKEIPQKPGYLCKVTTLVTSDKELGILLPMSAYKTLIGTPQKQISFVEKWPDMLEYRWHDDALSVFTEKGNVMRVTTTEPGAYLLLKPVDAASQNTYQIKVGMTKAELYGVLNEKSAVVKNLAQGGKIEEWSYFPGLGMGVRIENDKVVALTVTPVYGD